MYFWGSWSVDLRIISAILGPFRPRAIFPYISYSYKCAASNGKAVLEWEHGYIFRPPVWSEIGNFVGAGVQTYICARNTVQCKIKPRNVHFSRTNGVMVSQTEYIFQKPGLKKSMENGWNTAGIQKTGQHSPQPKIPRSIPYPPATGRQKSIFFSFLFYKK